MAQGSGMPSYLSIKLSSQSGTKAMAAAWTTLYEESCSQAFLFSGATISLANMLAGDTIDIKIEKVLVSGGAYVLHDLMPYNDAQPANHPSCSISGIPSVYGIKISARQTAGALINCDCEFYDAKRLGMT
jgi:hypothetical protein